MLITDSELAGKIQAIVRSWTNSGETNWDRVAQAVRELFAETEKYNGWTNRETWAAFSWLTSEEDLYDQALRQGSPDSLQSMVEDIAYDVSDDNAEDVEREMVLDIGSLWRVNWKEIFDALHEGEEGGPDGSL